MRTAKLVFLLLSFYVTAGIIQYPWWWYSVISSRNFHDFLYEALGPYFYYNLAAAIGLAALAYFHRRGETGQELWTTKLNAVIDGKLATGLIWGLALLGISRALFVGIESNAQTSLRAVERTEEKRTDTMVTLPIELVFVDRGRLADTFGQLQGELKLTEQKVSTKDSVEAEGESNLGPAKVSAKKAVEGERSATFHPIEPNDPVKIVKTIEYLDTKSRLLTIRSIELQSNELKEFENAVNVLSVKHAVALPKGALDERRRALIEQNLKQAAPKEFSVGSWVLIDGITHITLSGKSVGLRFDYVPSLPSRVSFSCSVPMSDVKIPMPSSGKDALHLDLRVFGKIVSMEEGKQNQVQYGLSCYAAFR